MNEKPLPPDEDVRQLAKRLKTLWTPKQSVRRFLRKHATLFRELKSEDWSWAGIALALNKAKITYRTDRPWTGTALMQAFSRAQVELKGPSVRATNSRQHGESSPTPPAVARTEMPHTTETTVPAFATRNAVLPSALPVRQFEDLGSVFDEPHEEAEPEFRPVRFIDWDERRRLACEAAAATPAQAPHNEPPIEQFSEHYRRTMERLTGKKSPF
ncbi:hypothetical protein [Acidocella sp.]|uniref:hypothetical protein n=1 Tax=Acidocella sp. TaxID=50710 RepID=UPI003D050312